MSDVYGRDLTDFLELDPDEIAAAIWPEVKRAWESRPSGRLVARWNLLNDARTRYGGEVANRVSEGWQWLVNQGYLPPSMAHSDPGVYQLTRAGLAFEPSVHVPE